jgi:hypothetical protein
MLAWSVIDIHRAHFSTAAYNQGGKKTVHVVKEGHCQEGFAGKHLEPTTGIRGMVFEEKDSHTVGDTRGEFFHPTILTPSPVTGYEPQIRRSISCVENLQQARDIGWIILSVTIKRGNQWSARLLDPCVDSRALPVTLSQPNDLQLWQPAAEGNQTVPGIIHTAVVHINNLVLQQAFQNIADLIYQ